MHWWYLEHRKLSVLAIRHQLEKEQCRNILEVTSAVLLTTACKIDSDCGFCNVFLVNTILESCLYFSEYDSFLLDLHTCSFIFSSSPSLGSFIVMGLGTALQRRWLSSVTQVEPISQSQYTLSI